MYSYMKRFEADPQKILTVSNLVFPDVWMLHVLAEMKGTKNSTYTDKKIITLKLCDQGLLSLEAYDATIRNLVNFLFYIGAKIKLEQEQFGTCVLWCLCVFLAFSYLLKIEYLQDV